VEREEEEEGNAETVRSDAPSHEPSREDVEPYSGQNMEDEQGSACSGVTPMRMVNDGDRRASNVVTRMKTKPRMRKASVLRVSPYTNLLL